MNVLFPINLFITNLCNQSCPYCFCKDWITNDEKNTRHISLEDIDAVIDWIKRASIDVYVHLLGGEPMLHPDIVEIVRRMKRNHINLSIFTNGTGDTETCRQIIEDDCAKIWLVNINNPNTYTADKWKLLNRNLELMKFRGGDTSTRMEDVQRLQLGINLYYPNQDFSYFINLAKKYECPYVRFSLSMPSASKSNQYVDFEELFKIKPTLFEFIRNCVREDIAVGWDCIVPPCIFTAREMSYLTHFTSHFASICRPHFDILDLKAAYCVPMRGILPLYDIRDFSIEEVFEKHTMEAKKYKEYTLSRCKNCHYFNNGQCQGFCLRYKADLLNQVKEPKMEKAPALDSLGKRFRHLISSNG